MKIIKNGNFKKLKVVKTFDCEFCGCLFEADNTEYKVGSQYNELFFYVKCPFCGRYVYKGDD